MKKWNMIIEREGANKELRHWYFSFDLGTMTLYPTGYRLYQPGANGYIIAERAYPGNVGLPDVKSIESIEIPDDVKREALVKFSASIKVDILM